MSSPVLNLSVSFIFKSWSFNSKTQLLFMNLEAAFPFSPENILFVLSFTFFSTSPSLNILFINYLLSNLMRFSFKDATLNYLANVHEVLCLIWTGKNKICIIYWWLLQQSPAFIWFFCCCQTIKNFNITNHRIAVN